MASDLIKTIKRLIKPTVMKSGEVQVKKKVWRRYSDAELADSDQKFSIGKPYDNMAPYSKWSVRGLSNDEIFTWMKQVRMNAPDFMFRGLMAVAEKELQPSRWEIIRNTLSREFRII
jgi:hypothetical protein